MMQSTNLGYPNKFLKKLLILPQSPDEIFDASMAQRLLLPISIFQTMYSPQIVNDVFEMLQYAKKEQYSEIMSQIETMLQETNPCPLDPSNLSRNEIFEKVMSHIQVIAEATLGLYDPSINFAFHEKGALQKRARELALVAIEEELEVRICPTIKMYSELEKFIKNKNQQNPEKGLLENDESEMTCSPLNCGDISTTPNGKKPVQKDLEDSKVFATIKKNFGKSKNNGGKHEGV